MITNNIHMIGEQPSNVVTLYEIDISKNNGYIAKELSEFDEGTPDYENMDYKSAYYHLFNGISDTIKKMNEKYRIGVYAPIAILESIDTLKHLQYDAEEFFLNLP